MVAIWTTRDGREIPVTEMDDRHLGNAIRFVKRAAENYRYAGLSALSYSTTAPDGAAYAAERAADEAFDEAENCAAWGRILQAEADRRGLKL